MATKPEWDVICTTPGANVRRLRIDGGWLYQVQVGSTWLDFNKQTRQPVWGETTFVAGPPDPHPVPFQGTRPPIPPRKQG